MEQMWLLMRFRSLTAGRGAASWSRCSAPCFPGAARCGCRRTRAPARGSAPSPRGVSLRIAHVAVEENAHAQAQIGSEAARAGARSRPCRRRRSCGSCGSSCPPRRCSTRSMHVADLLHVDGEGDDVGPAPALALGQRLSRDLREIELDRGVELVDRVVHVAQAVRPARGRCGGCTGRMPRSMVSTTSAWCRASRAAQLMARDWACPAPPGQDGWGRVESARSAVGSAWAASGRPAGPTTTGEADEQHRQARRLKPRWNHHHLFVPAHRTVCCSSW